MKTWGEEITDIWCLVCYSLGFPGSSVLKNLSAIQETQVQSLDRKDPLREDMATHSSTLA